MDSSTMTSLRSQEDFTEEFLTCSICTEPFDDDKRQAKCLPCQHSYCKSCLTQHVGKRARFNCPNCRKLVTLPGGGTIDNLPNNFIVQNLKEYQETFNLTVFCGGCDDKCNRVVSYCNECACFLCRGCIDTHKKLRPLRSHRLSTLAELRDRKPNPVVQEHLQCEKHPQQDLNMYCRTCRVPICATCGLIDHRGHDLIEQTVAIEEIVAQMRTSLTRIHNKKHVLITKRAHVETMRTTVTENFDRVEKEISESEHKLIALLKSRYGEAKSHLSQLYRTEMKHLRLITESIDLLSAQMTSACEFANKACDISHIKQMPIPHIQIIEQLEVLENTELPNTTSNNIGFALTDKHHSALKGIEESLPDLCDVEWLKHREILRDAKGNITDGPASQGYLTSLCRPSKIVLITSVMVILLSFLTHHKLKPQIDPSRCMIELGPPCNDNDENDEWFRTAIIQTVDNYGHLMNTGGATVVAYYKDLSDAIYVQDYYDGAYTFEYDCWETVHVKINDVEMDGSPFDMEESNELSIITEQ